MCEHVSIVNATRWNLYADTNKKSEGITDLNIKSTTCAKINIF